MLRDARGAPTVVVPVPAAGSVAITQGIVSVQGVTDDGYVVYFDTEGGVSVADVDGNVTPIRPPPSGDAGGVPLVYVEGNFVAILADPGTTLRRMRK